MDHILYTFACLLVMFTGIQACPQGWLYWSRSCYLVSENAVKYEDALQFCTDRKSSLVNINSALENCFIYDILVKQPRKFYLGIVRDPYDNSRFFTSKGKKLEYISWGKGQPNNATVCEMCVEMNVRVWSVIPCTSERRFICESKATCKNSPCQNGGKCVELPDENAYPYKCECKKPFFGTFCENEQKACPEGWVSHSYYCYQKQRGPRPWFHARALCQTKDGDIPDVQSAEEDAFLHKTFNQHNFWIGVIDCLNGKKCTTDYGAPKYTNWATGEPKDFGGNARACATIAKNSGNWHDEDCDKNQDFVCKKAAYV